MSTADAMGRQVIVCAQVGVVVADLEQRITVWNPYMVRLTGIPEDDVVGRPAFETLPLLVSTGVVTMIERALTGQTCDPLELCFPQRSSGAPMRASVVTAPLWDERGAVAGCIGMVTDVTERWRAAESMRVSERRTARAQSIGQVGNWEIDLGTRTVWATAECFRIYGLRDSGSSTLPLEVIQAAVLPEYRSSLDEALARIVAGTGPYDEEFMIERVDSGERRIIHSKAELQRDDDGVPVSVLGVLQDVTGLKAAEREAVEAAARLRRAMDGTVRAMGAVVETRDPYTAGHQRRVARLAVALGGEMGLPAATLGVVRLCSELHDIGKVAVPAEILTKPGRLTDAEFAIVKAHAPAGAEILEAIDFGAPVAAIVRAHHERLDGSGYPEGLDARAVPLESRVIAVADVVEAMSSHRPYRPALGSAAALEEIRRGAARLYDADVAAACARVFAGGFAFED